MGRYVVFRPSPTEGWCVQYEEVDAKGVYKAKKGSDGMEFPLNTKFAEAHDWALAQHPGMDVFVPQTNYVQGMTPEEDVAAMAASGQPKEES